MALLLIAPFAMLVLTPIIYFLLNQGFRAKNHIYKLKKSGK